MGNKRSIAVSRLKLRHFVSPNEKAKSAVAVQAPDKKYQAPPHPVPGEFLFGAEEPLASPSTTQPPRSIRKPACGRHSCRDLYGAT
jgi:hypothetical protein